MRLRAALHLALWFLLATTLGGCGSLPFLDNQAADADPVVKREPQFRLEIDAPAPLRRTSLSSPATGVNPEALTALGCGSAAARGASPEFPPPQAATDSNRTLEAAILEKATLSMLMTPEV